jgi:hypothetical protein
MNVEQMKTVLKEILAKTELTPCVVGHRGVGKTAGIVQACREMGKRYVPLRLGQMEVGDLVGIPYREESVMHWSRPCWWPGDDDGDAVVHCDELNRAQQEDTLQAIFQFVEPPAEGQARALHTHTLHSRHKVVVTINPPDGTYQVAPLDRALIDRMVMIYVETDYQCWANHARERRFDRDVCSFLSTSPQMLSRQVEVMELQAEPTERGWEMVSTLRRLCRFPAELEMEVYAGVVGTEAAVAFLSWLGDRKNRPVPGLEVLENWPQVAPKVTAQRDDLQAATMTDLVGLLQGRKNIDDRQADNVVSYLRTLPRDLRFGLVKSLLRIPAVALALSSDRYDGDVLEAIRTISCEA